MTQRIEKVNSLLEREISKIIARDFSFAGDLVTLTRVETFANLVGAKAYISVLPDHQTDKVVKILNTGAHDVQQKINKKLNMRPIPKIMFVKDENIAEAARIEGLFEQLKKEDK